MQFEISGRKLKIATALTVLGMSLGACATDGLKPVVSIQGACDSFVAPKVAVHGATRPDQHWVDVNIEGGVTACHWKRPAAVKVVKAKVVKPMPKPAPVAKKVAPVPAPAPVAQPVPTPSATVASPIPAPTSPAEPWYWQSWDSVKDWGHRSWNNIRHVDQ